MNETARNAGAVRTVDSITMGTSPFADVEYPPSNMATSRLSLVASVLWLVVAASPATWWIRNDDHWQIGYGIFSLLLSTAAALTAGASIRLASNGSWGPVALLGAALTVIGVCSTLIAWASPVWMLGLGIGFGVFAIGAPEHRRVLARLAAAQFAGLAIVVAGEAVGVGAPYEQGTHLVTQAAGLVIAGLLTARASVLLAREARPAA